MKRETILIVILLAINLILPGMVEAAESLQKIRVGLPSLALPTCLFIRLKRKAC